MRYLTGSQWSSFKSCVTWSRFDFFKISRAALFWIFCMRAIYIYMYVWLKVTENGSVFSLCCDRATQSHSFHPLTIHSSIHLQTHSHSTDHSLIPQARAIIQYNFIARFQYTDCTRNVLWCQVHSSHIHSNHKTLNYNNSK